MQELIPNLIPMVFGGGAGGGLIYGFLQFLNARKDVQTKRFEAETKAINDKTNSQSAANEAQARVTTTLLNASNTNMENLYQRMGELEQEVSSNRREISLLRQQLARYSIMFEAIPIVLPPFLKRVGDLPLVMSQLKRYVDGNYNTTTASPAVDDTTAPVVAVSAITAININTNGGNSGQEAASTSEAENI